jgi:hypothetical protein
MRAQRLEDSHSEFEQAVFRAAYDSALQRRRRSAAFFLLLLKHSARGLFFSWPVYVLVLAVAFGDSFYSLAYLLLLIPALVLSVHILVRGVRDDYRVKVHGLLLKKGFVRPLLFAPAPH